MRLQQRISLGVNQGWVGRSLPVLVDAIRDEVRVGRSHRDAPEIDGLVYFKGTAQPGEIVNVRVDRAEPYDLFGTITPNLPAREGPGDEDCAYTNRT